MLLSGPSRCYYLGQVVLFFFWGFKGQVRWPEGPPHLALNPPYLFFVCFGLFWFFFFCFFFVFFGSGEVARRATSLGPKPSLFYFLFSLLLIDKKPVFPLEKGIFGLLLSVSLSFSLAFFGLPLFQFLLLCLSLVLFFLFFLLVFLVLLSFCSLFFSLSFPFFLLCFCFMKGTTSKH